MFARRCDIDQYEPEANPSRQDQEALRRDIIEGCREMADIYLEIEREFHPLEEEVERLYNTEETPLDVPPLPSQRKAHVIPSKVEGSALN